MTEHHDQQTPAELLDLERSLGALGASDRDATPDGLPSRIADRTRLRLSGEGDLPARSGPPRGHLVIRAFAIAASVAVIGGGVAVLLQQGTGTGPDPMPSETLAVSFEEDVDTLVAFAALLDEHAGLESTAVFGEADQLLDSVGASWTDLDSIGPLPELETSS